MNSEENFYSPPASQFEPDKPLPVGPDTFGSVDIGRAVNQGISSFFNQFLVSGAIGLVSITLLLVVFVLSFMMVGLIILPHLTAGLLIAGMQTAQSGASLESLFHPFQKFGRVMGAGLIKGSTFLIITIIFYAPFTAFLVLMSIADDHSGAIFKWLSDKSSSPIPGIGLVFFSLFIIISVPVLQYISGRLILVYPLIVRRNYNIIQSIRVSWEKTHSERWKLFLIMMISWMIINFGICLCYIGFVFSLPAGMAIQGAAVLQLLGEDARINPPADSGAAL